MVFPGKRSTGCHDCRRRKVKCDGAKPECQRCISRGVQCPGYPEGFVFREYGPSATTTRNNRQQQPRMTVMDKKKYPEQMTLASPKPRSGPALNLEWQALCYFVHHHVLHVHKSPCRGYLAFFPDLYREVGDHCLCLQHAVLGVASLALFNTSRVGQLYVNARKHYGSVMRFLSHALGSSETAVEDEVFAASLLLSVFADLSGETGDGLNPHIPGAYSLLQLRGRSQLNTKYGRELYGWAVTQVQTRAIIHGEFRYATLPQSVSTMYKPDNIYRAGIVTGMISELCRSIDETRSMLSRVRSPSAVSKKLIYSLFTRAQCLIGEIDTWHDAVPQHWKRQYQPTYDTNGNERDQWTTCFLATVHSAQITFYTQLLDFYDHLAHLGIYLDGHSYSKRLVQPLTGLESRIQNLLEMICSTVAFSLGKIDANGDFQASSDTKVANGYVLRLPMRVVVDCRFSTAEQVDLCSRGLGFVGLNIMPGHLVRPLRHGN